MGLVDGGRLFARALKKEGVEQVFALAGGHIMPIFYGCRAEGIEVVDFRHENVAVNAADAYARVTGRPGVVITTAGPGITHTVTAMSEALAQGVPLIQIGGASPVIEDETGPLQNLNTLDIMSTVSKWARKISHVHRIPEYVSMAYRYAFDATPGPVYLEIGQDILMKTVEEERVLFPGNYRTTAQPFGDPSLVERAAQMLVEAKCPAMIVGDHARFSAGYGEAVLELAEYLKMPVMTQPMSRGLFASEEDHPLFTIGFGVAGADVVLLLSVLNDYRVLKLKPPLINPQARLIQVNPDVTKIGYNAPAEVGIVGGAGAVAMQILDAVKRRTVKQEDLTWVKTAEGIAQFIHADYEAGFKSPDMPMNPGRCAWEVGRFLAEEGRDWTVVCDGGDAAQWIKAAAKARRPGQIVNLGPNGTIGTGPGFTIGAWAANRKPVLYYTGDGSFGFYGMEFDTFERLGIPVVCVISNDSAWGMIKLSETFLNPGEIEERGHCGVDLCHMRAYEKMAAVWGGYGEQVRRPEDILPAIERAAATGRPSIINVEVDKHSMSPITKMFGYSLMKK
jgi:acetolactate synthase I/II/III large subunit